MVDEMDKAVEKEAQYITDVVKDNYGQLKSIFDPDSGMGKEELSAHLFDKTKEMIMRIEGFYKREDPCNPYKEDMDYPELSLGWAKVAAEICSCSNSYNSTTGRFEVITDGKVEYSGHKRVIRIISPDYNGIDIYNGLREARGESPIEVYPLILPDVMAAPEDREQMSIEDMAKEISKSTTRILYNALKVNKDIPGCCSPEDSIVMGAVDEDEMEPISSKEICDSTQNILVQALKGNEDIPGCCSPEDSIGELIAEEYAKKQSSVMDTAKSFYNALRFWKRR